MLASNPVLEKKETLSPMEIGKISHYQVGSNLYSSEKKSGQEGLLEPYNYLRPNTGKDMKMNLLYAFQHWMNVSENDMEFISRITQATHRAGLIIDDIQDNTEIRRGALAAHRVYGIPLTMNSAYYVLFLMISDAVKINRPEMLAICIEEVTNLHYGQGVEIYFRDAFICHTEQEYIEMVNAKTGALLIMAIRLMQASSESKVDYTPLVYKIGLHLQIRNDYLNLYSKDYTDNQGFCTDFEEGKFSFPVIHSIQSNPSDTRLLEILKKRSKDIEVKKAALRILAQTDSLSYSRKYLKTLEREIRADIKHLGGNSKLEKIIDAVSIKNELIYVD
ncbi:geranylgeranyl pyrophosphate synthase [Backusella circina FSU 941]|nr:geranylgeranyl pyrophosphate synthase [Backusella circina FSU 941]